MPMTLTDTDVDDYATDISINESFKVLTSGVCLRRVSCSWNRMWLIGISEFSLPLSAPLYP